MPNPTPTTTTAASPSFQCPLPVSEQPDFKPASLSQELFRLLDALPTCSGEETVHNKCTLSVCLSSSLRSLSLALLMTTR